MWARLNPGDKVQIGTSWKWSLREEGLTCMFGLLGSDIPQKWFRGGALSGRPSVVLTCRRDGPRGRRPHHHSKPSHLLTTACGPQHCCGGRRKTVRRAGVSEPERPLPREGAVEQGPDFAPRCRHSDCPCLLRQATPIGFGDYEVRCTRASAPDPAAVCHQSRQAGRRDCLDL